MSQILGEVLISLKIWVLLQRNFKSVVTHTSLPFILSSFGNEPFIFYSFSVYGIANYKILSTNLGKTNYMEFTLYEFVPRDDLSNREYFCLLKLLSTKRKG